MILKKQNMPTKKLFLFDFDGVVVDSLELYENAVNRCLKTLGKPPFNNRSEFLDVFDHNFYEGIARKGVDVSAFTEVSARLAPDLDYSIVTPVTKMAPVLETLMKNHILFVISSNSTYAIQRILSGIGYDRYFENILGLEFMLSKVEKIRHVTELLKTERDRTFYIGDTTGDIREAKNAGVRTVAVTWGWHSRETLEKTNPDFLVDSPEELLLL
jgi:phosphoglycolate phosphatase